ncbi:MAG: flagellin [Clostridia bacterium]|nr:flagellin [Clostridia bacterium]
MRINTNIMALNAQNKLTSNQSSVEKSIQKLSSGLRINSAADDAAGLAISEKMRAQIRGLGQAQDNAQDGISLLQTAEGALQQTTDILQRMRELVIKAQNTGVLTDDDRTSINTELSTLRDEIDRIATSTTFNGKKLLDGSLGSQLDKTNTAMTYAANVNVANAAAGTTYTVSVQTIGGEDKLRMVWSDDNGAHTAYSDVVIKKDKLSGKVNFSDAGVVIDYGADDVAKGSLGGKIVTADTETKAQFKIGANTYEEDVLSAGIADMSSKGLNRKYDGETKFSIDISTATAANDTLDAIDYALNTVSSQRATLGTIQNRMEYAVSNLSTTEENLTAAESRIRDVDMAEEMVSYTKNSILNQSAMAMLAQANQQPQSILALLQ